MKFQTKTYTLKSGDEVRIRVPEMSEAQDLVDLKRSYIRHTNTIPMYLEEYPDDKIAESKLIGEYHESPNSILLVAVSEDKLIGNIDLTGSKRLKMFHTAMLGMGIAEGWRNQGLGGCLMETAINWAKEHSEIELIWLDVYASNELGLNLYKNMGFEVSGLVPRFFQERDGYVDKIQMYRRI